MKKNVLEPSSFGDIIQSAKKKKMWQNKTFPSSSSEFIAVLLVSKVQDMKIEGFFQ